MFITKGMQIRVPVGGLKLSSDGTASLEVEVLLYTHSYWLDIALDHLERAATAETALKAAWGGSDEELKGKFLESLFAASMQAIVAAAVALDAFYAAVKVHRPVAPDVVKAWAKNKTSRPTQIAEVLRSCFKLNAASFAEFKKILGQLFEWRDWTVHPPAHFRAPLLAPHLGVATEWRFAIYSAENARRAVGFAIRVLAQLLRKPRPGKDRLETFCSESQPLVAKAVMRFEGAFGPLNLDAPPNAPSVA